MRKSLAILLAIISLSACMPENPRRNNYKRTFLGTVTQITEYPNANCNFDFKKEENWIAIGVNLNDCQKIKIGDKVLIVEEVKNGIVWVSATKLNSNLP